MSSKALTATKKKTKTGKRMRQWPWLVMLLPGLAYLIINNYIPMLGIVIAFKDLDFSKGILKSDWVGFKNFEFLFKTSDAWVITRNTLLYNIVFIILGTVVGVTIAIMLNELLRATFRKVYQTVLLLPQLISMVVVAYIVYAFLNSESGFVNNSLLQQGINFYGEKQYWPFILTFVNIWKGMGYGCIVYLSAIMGIDQSMYESARVDGAGRLKQIFYITLPLLKPTIVTMVMMSIGRIFYSDFGLFYQVTMNSGALYDYTSTIDTYVYRALMQRNDLAMSSAAGVFQSIVGFVMILAVNALVRKVDEENALF